MADEENHNNLGEILKLQPLFPIPFSNEKAGSNQQQQQQPDLQACLTRSFQLFTDSITSMFEDFTSKIGEKSPSRAKAQRKRPRKSTQSDN